MHRVDGSEPPQRLAGLDIGRPVLLQASPTRDQVALTNHRFELVLVDLEQGEAKVLDRSLYSRLPGLAWAPDGHWLAYGFFNSEQTSIIKLAEVDSGATHEVTRPVLRDEEPAWDPDGRYLYFLSARDFDPVYDSLHFELNFPRHASLSHHPAQGPAVALRPRTPCARRETGQKEGRRGQRRPRMRTTGTARTRPRLRPRVRQRPR